MADGALPFTFHPPRAHPILYAGLMVTGFVFITGSIENLLREARTDLFLWYLLPFLVTAWVFVAGTPSPTRITAEGIAPSRPLVLWWRRRFIRWTDLAAVYPAFYDVTGAFVSPFASSDGKVTQMGLALEWPDGRSETVKFTPSRLRMWHAETPEYLDALAAVREAFGAAARPLVPEAKTFDAAEAERMVEEASKPFLPFFAIVLLFASAAPVLWVLTWLGVPVAASLPIALVAPLAVSLRSWSGARRRHRVLNALSKAAEYQRHAGRA